MKSALAYFSGRHKLDKANLTGHSIFNNALLTDGNKLDKANLTGHYRLVLANLSRVFSKKQPP